MGQKWEKRRNLRQKNWCKWKTRRDKKHYFSTENKKQGKNWKNRGKNTKKPGKKLKITRNTETRQDKIPASQDFREKRL